MHENVVRELDASNAQIDQVKDSIEAANAEYQQLLERQMHLQEELAKGGGQELLQAIREREELEKKIESAKQRQQEHEEMVAKVLEEKKQMEKQLEKMMFGEIEPVQAQNKPKLRSEDVVLLKGDQGIAVVQYVGEVEGREGEWIGIELSDPVGECDGTMNGKEYFKTEPLCASFIQ